MLVNSELANFLANSLLSDLEKLNLLILGEFTINFI